MTSLVVAHFKVIDREGYERYVGEAIPLIASYRGKTIVADDAALDVARETADTRAIVIAFPSRQEAVGWLSSPEYQEIGKIRELATTTYSVVVADVFDSVAIE